MTKYTSRISPRVIAIASLATVLASLAAATLSHARKRFDYIGQVQVYVTDGTKVTAVFPQGLTGSLTYSPSWAPSVVIGPGAVTNYTGGNQYNMASIPGAAHTLVPGDCLHMTVVQNGITYKNNVYPALLVAGTNNPVLVEPVHQPNGTSTLQIGFNTGPGTIAVYYAGTNTLAAPLAHSANITLPGPGEYTYYQTAAFVSSINATDPAVLTYRDSHRLGVPFYAAF